MPIIVSYFHQRHFGILIMCPECQKQIHNYSKIICPYKRSVRILHTRDMH